jgi:hypothetical protein
VSFTLDRYGHLFPEADENLRDGLELMFDAAHATPPNVVSLTP